MDRETVINTLADQWWGIQRNINDLIQQEETCNDALQINVIKGRLNYAYCQSATVLRTADLLNVSDDELYKAMNREELGET